MKTKDFNNILENIKKEIEIEDEEIFYDYLLTMDESEKKSMAKATTKYGISEKEFIMELNLFLHDLVRKQIIEAHM